MICLWQTLLELCTRSLQCECLACVCSLNDSLALKLYTGDAMSTSSYLDFCLRLMLWTFSLNSPSFLGAAFWDASTMISLFFSLVSLLLFVLSYTAWRQGHGVVLRRVH